MSLQQRFKQKHSQPAPSPIPFQGPRLLSIREAAVYLSISVDLVRKMVAEREIPHIVKGNGEKRVHVLIDVHDLNRWIEKSKRGVVAA